MNSPKPVIVKNGELEDGASFSEFLDRNSNRVRVSDANPDPNPAIWLEAGEIPRRLERLHAKALIRILQRFVDTESVRDE